ncbi:hypothetical protein [Leifsonia sp. AG29]|uniref:hypothetical protein n=1 Tax=Leifsonia sp. AG29 TaxID=2598860 RepID=UPI00131AE031|nr:hypothetical protein [Leifsonia sp. AG29]
MNADIVSASTLSPGAAPGGIPLRIHLGEQEYAALVRIATKRHTTASKLVEQLVLNALTHAEVPAPSPAQPKRPHVSYEEATRGFLPDMVAGREGGS